jgi:hypothetical protein
VDDPGMEHDPDADDVPRLEPMDDRNVRIVLVAMWAVGLAIVLLRGLDLVAYLFLTAYVLGLLYALHLRAIGDPEGQTAIWWALIIPPLAWWTFLLHWLEHRAARNNPDEPTVHPPIE